MKTSIHHSTVKVLSMSGDMYQVLLSCGHAIWTAGTREPACYKCWLDYKHPDDCGVLWEESKRKIGHAPENWAEYKPENINGKIG